MTDDLLILKRAVKDYQDLKFTIGTLKELGCDYDVIKFYLRRLNCVNTTNEDDAYLDFNYRDMCLTIRKDEDYYLTDDIEVYNDYGFPSLIGHFNNIKEIEEEIEKTS